MTKQSKSKKKSRNENQLSEDMYLEIQLSRQLVNEIQAAYKAGKEYDIDSASERTGLDRQEVAELFDIVTRQMDVWNQEVVLPPDEERHLLAVPEPSKENKERFWRDIESNELFSIDTSDAIWDFFGVSTKDKFAKKLSACGLVELIVDPFRDHCPRETNLLINSFFYLLCVYGDRWVPARSYYVTIYKWFGNHLDVDLDDPEYMESFSLFIIKKLRTRAVCQIQHTPDFDQRLSGKFNIRATPFFQRFITLSSKKSLN